MVDYNAFAKTFSQSRKNMKWPEIDAILEDIQKNHFQKILDIGCWNGRFLQQFFEKFWHFPEKYTGIDGSKNMILEAKNTFPDADFFVCQMQDFSHSNSHLCKFDAIIFLASFHHLQTQSERQAVLENIKSFLAKNGKIYMTNWNLLGQEKYKNAHMWNNDFSVKIGDFTRYYHGFSVEELKELFKDAQYSIEENYIFEGNRNIFSIIKNPS